MATHSSILAWRTPWTEEPGRLQSVHGVAKNWRRLNQLTLTRTPGKPTHFYFSCFNRHEVISQYSLVTYVQP